MRCQCSSSQPTRPPPAETGVVFAGSFAMLTTTAYGIARNWDPSNPSGSITAGATYAWYGNGYTWDYFFAAASSSVVGLALMSGLAQALAMCGVHGPGISDIMGKIPGFKLLAGGSSAASAPADSQQFDLDKDIAIRT
jgi:hypothetical protein